MILDKSSFSSFNMILSGVPQSDCRKMTPDGKFVM